MLRVDTEMMQRCVRELNYICARIQMNEDELCAVAVHLDHISEGMDRCRTRVKEQALVLRNHSTVLSNFAKTLERAAERYDGCERKCNDIGMKTRGKAALPTGLNSIIDPIPYIPTVPSGSHSHPVIRPFVLIPGTNMLVRAPEGSRLCHLMPGTGFVWRIINGSLSKQKRHKFRNPFYISPRELDDAVVKALRVK